GEACCASPTLLGKILRGDWGFEGVVVSDCGAIEDLHNGHLIDPTPEAAAAHALREGCDLECGWTYPNLKQALAQGLITEADLDRALKRSQAVLMRCGWYDDAPAAPVHADPGSAVVDSPEHQALALEAARASIVLLRNAANCLPLGAAVKSIAVIGPNADNREMLLGNYNGTPSRPVTLLEGLRNLAPSGCRVTYAQGCALTAKLDVAWGERPDGLFAEALAAAQGAEVTVLCLGLGQSLEGEQGGSSQAEWEGDRKSLGLPAIQQKLLDALVAQGKPLVLVLCAGSPLAVDPPVAAVGSILQAWYPGQAGGTAVAEILFGAVSPSGRLPVTFPRSVADLPPFVDYSMEGRTYRFATARPLYPFGFGLSYTRFDYGPLVLNRTRLRAGETVTATVTVTNVGVRGGGEVVQIYLEDLEASVRVPLRRLVGFGRVSLEPGASQELSFEVSVRQLALVTEAGELVVEPGWFRLTAGGRQPDARSAILDPTPVVDAEFEVLELQGVNR
ncbi:MAG: glycoside hydrolase family 3 C-terminal domain-containing protein, partial [Spirochaetales bacterium]